MAHAVQIYGRGYRILFFPSWINWKSSKLTMRKPWLPSGRSSNYLQTTTLGMIIPQQLLTQTEEISGMHYVSSIQKNAWSQT
jgi:hypothetical protein